ncbi:MAG: hypothetical protein LBL50_00440, partial [Candidatus Margulisbacteria bacterium]|nr:hypothetical protein [Candidatus Margulisiibacteriota bacterium]
MIYNNISSYPNLRKNNFPGFIPASLPLTFQQKSKPIKPLLVIDPDTANHRDNLNIEQAPIDIETDAVLSDLLMRRTAAVLLNDMVLPFEAEQDEFVLLGDELAARQKKVSASLVDLARYSSFSFDLTAAVNMTSDNWDELDTLYEYGGISYTEHIDLGQRRAQKLFDFLWAAVNDRAVLDQELSVFPARQKTAAEANLRIVRANLLRFTDHAAPPKLLPEYQKLCYVYDAGRGIAPPLEPQDKTPVYTYEQSLNGHNPRVGITGLVLAIVNPGSEAISQRWQDKGTETLVDLEKAVTQQIRVVEENRVKAEEEARVKAEEEARVKAEAEAQAKAEEEARIKAEAEAQAKAEEEARVKAEAEAQAKAEEEARVKAEAEAQAKAEEEARAEAEEEARIKAEEEARVKAGDEAKRKKLELTFSGGGVIKENEQAAWLQTTIMPRTFRPNIPGISSIKIGGGLDFSFHRKTERLTYQYLKPTPPPPANVAPTANAGNDQSITLPTNSTTLDGSASNDSDGSIASYEWTQVNGPATATINTPTGSSTSISGLTTAGTYTFRLKVTDNDGAESTDEVIVTVNAAPPPANVPPTANAGTDKNITLPTSSVTLDGSASNDSDGSIASYEWTQVNGPVTATINTPTGSSTSISGLTIAGTYTFRLKVTDNEGVESTDDVTVTVNAAPPPANVAPTANAGTDQSITLPTDSVTLDGSTSNDSDGSIASYEWTQISKPTSAPDAVISNAAGVTTNVSGLQEGTYVFQLKVIDDDGAGAVDTITITVAPQPTTTVYKNITIMFSNLPVPSSNGNATLDLAHTISASGGWDANFQESDISSQITGSVDAGSGYSDGEHVVVTKDFYYDGKNIATLTVTAEVEDQGGSSFVFN